VTVGTLALTPDELLTTTRAVRQRLDTSRPVDPGLLEQCVRIAQQAPNGSGREGWHFVVVTDPERRAALAELYRTGGEEYLSSSRAPTDPALIRSARHLITHLAEVPVHVIPCMTGRLQDPTTPQMSGFWGTIAPAVWSFMLAARVRGLGTVWTTFHLGREREAAELLGIPYERVTQVALLPVAHTLGEGFKPARRAPLEQIVHWQKWNEGGQ
jgi:nitroreductase